MECYYFENDVIVIDALDYTKIFDCNDIYIYDKVIPGLIRKINENIFYSINYRTNELFLYKIENDSRIKEFKNINLNEYGKSFDSKNIDEKIYVTIEYKDRNYLLMYNTKTNKFEIDSTINYTKYILKFGKLLLFNNSLFFDSNGKYDIFSIKPNIKNTNLHDIKFYFV